MGCQTGKHRAPKRGEQRRRREINFGSKSPRHRSSPPSLPRTFGFCPRRLSPVSERGNGSSRSTTEQRTSKEQRERKERCRVSPYHHEFGRQGTRAVDPPGLIPRQLGSVRLRNCVTLEPNDCRLDLGTHSNYRNAELASREIVL
jgi:hypothetical protein